MWIWSKIMIRHDGQGPPGAGRFEDCLYNFLLGFPALDIISSPHFWSSWLLCLEEC